TGMQATHTGAGVDLAAIAKASLFAETATLRTDAEVQGFIPKLYHTQGPVFAVAKVSTDKVPMTLPLRDGTHIKNRFREALLGRVAFE
ncbi:MAG: hypothetical protein ACM3SS_06995, partial [Rhodospirillaceae bacterium]